jgi:hypothetical protein
MTPHNRWLGLIVAVVAVWLLVVIINVFLWLVS